VLAVLFLGPSYLGDASIVLAFTLLLNMTMAQAWNLIGGYGGQFSLAQGMFVGVGSYTTAVLMVRTGVPLWLAIPIAGLVAAALGALAAVPLFRLRGVYFAVGSLGVALAVLSWMINWEFTNKTSSYSLPSSAFLGFEMQYYMAGAVAAVTTASVAFIARSRFGLRLMAVRDDEDAALELGVNSFAVKLGAFTLSAFFVGLAGALLALQKLTLEPYSAFSLTFTINMIIACVIGGLGTVVGPLLGAAVMFGLQQWLEDYADWSTLILGIALIVIIRIAPGGLVGLARGGWERLREDGPIERGLRRVS
jgi:branched-chain amino acid transport system permease protein